MFGPNRPAADIQGNGGFVFYLWRSQQVNRRQISLLLFLKISQLEAVEPGKQASSVLFLPEPKATGLSLGRVLFLSACVPFCYRVRIT